MARMITITDENAHLFVQDTTVNGQLKMRGLIPRNFKTHPLGYCEAAPPFDLPLIPESEWADRLAAQKAAKAQLSDIRDAGMNGKPIPALDQDGSPFCWAHSSVGAARLLRAAMNQPFADLSAYAVACKIKNFRRQGGWGLESTEFIADTGVPTAEFWPHQSMSRSNDNPQTWANAKQNRFTEWMDLDPRQMKAQLVTCLLLNIPVVSDFDWWVHSVVTMALVSLDPLITLILNSWSGSWGLNGTGQLQGRKAIPSAAVAPRVITGSLV